jgi:hypothetical protein
MTLQDEIPVCFAPWSIEYQSENPTPATNFETAILCGMAFLLYSSGKRSFLHGCVGLAGKLG